MSPRQRELRTKNAPNKSRGNRSPLDFLPASVRSEMMRRLQRGEIYRIVQQWLAAEHSLKIGISAISDWWRKIIVAGTAETTSETVHTGGFEITVTAPGAKFVTVKLVPTDAKKDGER